MVSYMGYTKDTSSWKTAATTLRSATFKQKALWTSHRKQKATLNTKRDKRERRPPSILWGPISPHFTSHIRITSRKTQDDHNGRSQNRIWGVIGEWNNGSGLVIARKVPQFTSTGSQPLAAMESIIYEVLYVCRSSYCVHDNCRHGMLPWYFRVHSIPSSRDRRYTIHATTSRVAVLLCCRRDWQSSLF